MLARTCRRWTHFSDASEALWKAQYELYRIAPMMGIDLDQNIQVPDVYEIE